MNYEGGSGKKEIGSREKAEGRGWLAQRRLLPQRSAKLREVRVAGKRKL
jgi:hypothetical protein